MKIFLSYGHEDFPDFVKRFVDDLSKYHTVWTDESIGLGTTWVQEIDDGIKEADLFLFLQAENSVRKGSYCYGEIIFAKNLKKKIVVVTLESVLTPTIIAQEQNFSMNDVFDFCGDLVEDEYDNCLKKLLTKIEECMITPPGAQERQIAPLKFFDNKQKISELLAEWAGSDALFDLTDKWLAGHKIHFALFGGAGSGKTTAASAVYERYKEKAIIHFCNYVNEKTTDIRIILQAIAHELSQISAEYRGKVADAVNFERNLETLSANDIFDELFLNTFSSMQSEMQYIIVFDGIDEIPQKQKKEFYRIVIKRFQELSGKVRIFLTSRKDSEIAPALYASGADILDNYEQFNTASIKAYITKWFNNEGMFFDESCLNKIISQSKGDFLYIKFILEELKIQGTSDVTNVIFPMGMKGICQSYFDRIFFDEDDFYTETVAPFLEIITVIKMPIPIQSLELLLNIDALDIRSIIKKLDMFTEIRDNRVMLVHKSVHDWLCSITLNDKYYISLNRGQKKICDFIIAEFSKGVISEYVSEFGFKHLAECGRLEKIAEIICNAPKDINTIFITFAMRMILEDETAFLIKLFAVFATREDSACFIVAEVIKLLLQYGKKSEAEDIVGSFDEGERKEQLKGFLNFYSAKVSNQNTSEIIEAGNAIIQLLKEEKIIAEILRILGDAYREKGHHKKAVELYQEGKKKSLEYRLDTIYLDCECALIDMEYVNGNIAVALKMLGDIKEKINFKTPNIYTYKYYRLLGNIFHLNAEIPEAMNAFNECELIANRLSFPLKLIETYNSIAELQPTYKLGKDYLEKSRSLSVHSDLNSLECGKSYYIEADLLLHNGQHEAAIRCADRAIEMLEKVGYGSGCARSYLIKGTILFELKQYDNAVLLFKKANAYFVREQIYPLFRLVSYYFILKCANELGMLNVYTAEDSIDYFNPADFPHLTDEYAYIKELTKC